MSVTDLLLIECGERAHRLQTGSLFAVGIEHIFDRQLSETAEYRPDDQTGFRLSGLRQQDDELIPSPSTCQIGNPDRCCEQRTELHQYMILEEVSESIIEDLEIIEIDEDQTERAVIAFEPSHLQLYHLLYPTAGEQLRKLVGIDEGPQILVGFPQVGTVQKIMPCTALSHITGYPRAISGERGMDIGDLIGPVFEEPEDDRLSEIMDDQMFSIGDTLDTHYYHCDAVQIAKRYTPDGIYGVTDCRIGPVLTAGFIRYTRARYDLMRRKACSEPCDPAGIILKDPVKISLLDRHSNILSYGFCATFFNIKHTSHQL